MTDPRKVYVGEISKRIKVKVGISLANISSAVLYVEKPDGSTAVTWTAIVLGDASNGWVYYDSIAGDLDVAGVYRLYAKLTFSDGRIFFGERTTFNVYNPSEG
jgi:uncharacterized membrane protein